MGTIERVLIISVSSELSALTLETSWFPEQPPQRHVVPLAPTELEHFQAAMLLIPFGSSPHAVSIESISSMGSTYKCTIRITSGGSRQHSTFEICANTHSAIQAVFDSNIISEEYIRA